MFEGWWYLEGEAAYEVDLKLRDRAARLCSKLKVALSQQDRQTLKPDYLHLNLRRGVSEGGSAKVLKSKNSEIY